MAQTVFDGLDVRTSLTLDSFPVYHTGNFDPSTKLDVTAFTANAVLALVKSVDGDGSALDADFLDGNHASAFAMLTGATFTGNVTIEANLPSLTIDTTNSTNQRVSYFRQRGNALGAAGLIAQHDFQTNHGASPETVAQWLVNRGGDVNLAVGELQVAGGEVWHANNDGAGSGLDADTLDGAHASQFAFLTGATFTGPVVVPSATVNGDLNFDPAGKIIEGFGASTTSGVLDWDDASNARAGSGNALLRGNDAANAPPAEGVNDYFHPFTYRYSVTDNLTQFAIPYGNKTHEMFMRGKFGGNWGTWTKFWTDQNQGTGSGLDADLLDGLEGSSYLRGDNTAQSGNQLIKIAQGSDFAVNQTEGGVQYVFWWDSSTESTKIGTDGATGNGYIDLRAPLRGQFNVQLDSASFRYGGGGGDCQVTFEKSSSATSASLLFSDDGTVHAEFGLIGSNDFELKVSPDGSTFNQAWVIDHTTRVTDFKVKPTVNGGDAWFPTEGETLNAADDLNSFDVLKGGVYEWSNLKPVNAPTQQTTYATMLQIPADSGGGGHQLLFSRASYEGMFYRSRSSSVWSGWRQLMERTAGGGVYFNDGTVASATDLSEHIDLRLGNYGINVQAGGIVNFVTNGSHQFLRADGENYLFMDANAARFDTPLGVGGATADTTNKLAVNSEAVLLNNAGDDMRLTMNKAAAGDDTSLTLQTNFSTRAQVGLTGDDDLRFKVSPDGSTFHDGVVIDRSTGRVTMPNTPYIGRFHKNMSGSFLLDPNEFNGWGSRGVVDEANTQDLGNVGANMARTSGGYMFPQDVVILGFKAWHYNSSSLAEAWGWRMSYGTKTADSNTQTTTNLWQECVGTGATAVAPRDYGNTTTRLTDEDWSANNWVLPAGSVLTMGVEAPTANATNYYVNVMSGYLLFEWA